MDMFTPRRFPLAFSTALLWIGAAAVAVEIDLERPEEREFVRDLADMLDGEHEERIRTICGQLLADRATPIIVVTISAMSEYGGEDLRIETFARLLFDQWQIGHATLGEQVWNTGILLLVSNGDRRARIELGGGWGREKDQICRQIMDEQIISRFKRGAFADGIVAGVEALDLMAREKSLPTVPRPWWHYALVVAAVALAIFTAVSLFRRGAGGWAWVLWAAVFGLVGYALYSTLTRRPGAGGDSFGGGSFSGGSFSGGSFGGGFSGGGGATGSW